MPVANPNNTLAEIRKMYRKTQTNIRASVPKHPDIERIKKMDRDFQRAAKAKYLTMLRPCPDCRHPVGEHNYRISEEGECADCCQVCFAKAHAGEAPA